MAFCVGLTLWLMMHWLGMPDTPLSPYYCLWAPPQTFPHQCCGWTGPCLLIMIAWHASATTVRELWKKIDCSQILEGTRHTQGPYSKVTGERGRECGPGALPLLVSKGGVPRVSWVHSLLANWKHESWNYDAGREKWGYWSSQLSRLPGFSWSLDFKVAAAWLFMWVAGNVCIGDGCLAITNRMAGTYIIIKKSKYRHLHYS